MNIGIFLENVTDTEINKDPGLIAKGLIKRGHTVTIFSYHASENVKKSFNTKIINKEKATDINFWKNSDVGTLIIYSWLSLRYSRMIISAKKAGLKIYLKLDSDGRLLYPLRPSYLKVFGLDDSIKAKIIHVLRLVQWYLFPRLITRQRLNQLKNSDGVIIESPQAKDNLINSLKYWHKDNLVSLIKIIPNPILSSDITPQQKENKIMAIGRWRDKRKNGQALIKILSQLNTNWQIHLIGEASDELQKSILKINKNLQIKASNKLTHAEVIHFLQSAKIIISPSLSESFNLAVAEALCAGCSVVGGPIPSFLYFIDQDNFGTLSTNFNYTSLLSALEKDVKKWEMNTYDAEQISAHWKKELNQEAVIDKIIDMIS